MVRLRVLGSVEGQSQAEAEADAVVSSVSALGEAKAEDFAQVAQIVVEERESAWGKAAAAGRQTRVRALVVAEEGGSGVVGMSAEDSVSVSFSVSEPVMTAVKVALVRDDIGHDLDVEVAAYEARLGRAQTGATAAAAAAPSDSGNEVTVFEMVPAADDTEHFVAGAPLAVAAGAVAYSVEDGAMVLGAPEPDVRDAAVEAAGRSLEQVTHSSCPSFVDSAVAFAAVEYAVAAVAAVAARHSEVACIAQPLVAACTGCSPSDRSPGTGSFPG